MQFNSNNFIELFIENETKIGILYDLAKANNNNINIINNNQINNEKKLNNSVNFNNFNIQVNDSKEKIQNKIIDNYIKTSEMVQRITSIKEEFIYPPQIGLQNVGATCYMNATLQCFCQIEKLVKYFK